MNNNRIAAWLYLLYLTLASLALPACSGNNEFPSIQPTVVITTESETTIAPIESEKTSPSEVTVNPPTLATTPSKETTAEPSPFISDAEAGELMDTILNGTSSEVELALDRIESTEDGRFISVLIDAYRGGQLGLLRTSNPRDIVTTLETVSGQSFGQDWPAWVEWYGKTDLQPPPGFTDWKGRMLKPIDPKFADFLQSSHPSNLRPEEIQWGGVIVDGIPALDNPKMLPADKALYLEVEDAVFGIALNGEARAYPLRILDWHEMANDVVGGVPVSLAYCTLCGAAIAYNGQASDGSIYTFGSSGFLYRSNKLMYDRQTRTLWNQLTGEPVLGELVESGERLKLLAVVLTTWQEWQNQHPDTLVVDIETGFPRNYTAGAAYGNYFADSRTMFPVAQRSGLLPAKSQVYVMRVNDIPKAYPLTILADEKVINDSIADTNLVLIAPNGIVQIDGENQYVGEVKYQAGGEVRAYARDNQIFSFDSESVLLLDDKNTPWQITEEALLGPDGEKLPRVPGHLAYWFGWYAFFPDTLVYSEAAR